MAGVEQIGERELPKRLRKRDPAGHGARNRDRVPTGSWHRLESGETCRHPVLRARAPKRSARKTRPPSDTIANRSLPRPLLHGSTTVSAIAVASAASTALPPLCSIAMPACVASGCEVATTLRAKIGCRRDTVRQAPVEALSLAAGIAHDRFRHDWIGHCRLTCAFAYIRSLPGTRRRASCGSSEE